MSVDEMREYCTSLRSFQVRVQIRLKNGTEKLVGRIGKVDAHCFQLVGDKDDIQSLNYTWVAKIHNM